MFSPVAKDHEYMLEIYTYGLPVLFCTEYRYRTGMFKKQFSNLAEYFEMFS
jgi:hypothetical protein